MKLREISVKEYPEGSVSKYTECSTIVPFRDAILLQLNSSKDIKVDVIIGKDAISDQSLTTIFEVHGCLQLVMSKWKTVLDLVIPLPQLENTNVSNRMNLQ